MSMSMSASARADEEGRKVFLGGLSFDVGVDCTDFRPLSLEEVAARMERLSREMDTGEAG